MGRPRKNTEDIQTPYYLLNREKGIGQSMARVERNRAIMLAAKSAGCVKCGEMEPVCLDFHHINPEHKSKEVNAMYTASVEKLVAEIAKCAVICSNCHRKLHAGLISL
jgi:hypothetical protein